MLKVVWNVVKSIFSIVFTVLSPLKRLWCRRKRRISDSILPIANYYPTENLTPPAQNDSTQLGTTLAPWDSWEDPQLKRQEQMSRYEQLRQQQLQATEPEPEPDYFQSMAPKVKKQTKILVKKDNEQINTGAISNRLAVASDIPLTQSSELESWQDETHTWEDEAGEDLSWEADNAIREKRKSEREQRHLQQQRKKQERDFKNNSRTIGQLSAVKLS